VTPRPGWIVGAAFAVALAWITWNTLSTPGPGGAGLRVGSTLPPFAAPLAGSRLQGDATVRARAGDGHPAACTVRGPDVLNSCELAEQGPVVLGFFIARSAGCTDEIDVLDRLRPRFPDVRFAAVAILGKREAVRADVREHGWKLPVGWDADGAVVNAYAVSGCPYVTLARRGGRVERTLLGQQDAAGIERAVRALGS
jgi:peroxiredoxin